MLYRKHGLRSLEQAFSSNSRLSHLVAGSLSSSSRTLAGQRNMATHLPLVSSQTLGALHESLLRKGKKVGKQLHENILLNANDNSGLRHIEMTPEFVRLEFSDANEEYKKFAKLMFASDEERNAQGVPQWLVPVDLHNNSYCGGGATVVLARQMLMEHLTSASSKTDLSH